jgi:SSS family solute:Na+ symporter
MPGVDLSLTNFLTLDWLIVLAFLVSSAIAGVWSKRYIRSLESFLIAGRRVRSYRGAASIIASEMGLVTVMYSAQKGFTGGFAAFHIALAAAVVALFVGLTGFIVIPLRRTGVMTILRVPGGTLRRVRR